MAEVATRALANDTVLADGDVLGERLRISSAGTGPWHEGGPMDPRTAAALKRAGFPDHPHVAHHVSVKNLRQCDLIVALDRGHQQTLRSLCANPSNLFLLRSFDASAGAASDVPDPYYGDDAGFDRCLEMIVQGCRGLVSALASLWDSPPPSDRAEWSVR
jgi:protein-tyrosine phosphatase